MQRLEVSDAVRPDIWVVRRQRVNMFAYLTPNVIKLRSYT